MQVSLLSQPSENPHRSPSLKQVNGIMEIPLTRIDRPPGGLAYQVRGHLWKQGIRFHAPDLFTFNIFYIQVVLPFFKSLLTM